MDPDPIDGLTLSKNATQILNIESEISRFESLLLHFAMQVAVDESHVSS
jgi:hypothetical protein